MVGRIWIVKHIVVVIAELSTWVVYHICIWIYLGPHKENESFEKKNTMNDVVFVRTNSKLVNQMLEDITSNGE